MIANWATGPMNPTFELPTGPSQTVPDQVISIAEIVARFVRGDPNVKTFQGVYDENFPAGLENLDQLERLEMAQSIKEGTKDIQDRLAKTKQSIEKHKEAIEKAKIERDKLPAKADSASGSLDAKSPTELKPGS